METRWKVIGAYVGTTAMCLAVLLWVMQLWHADLAVPFGYEGDSLLHGALIKGGGIFG